VYTHFFFLLFLYYRSVYLLPTYFSETTNFISTFIIPLHRAADLLLCACVYVYIYIYIVSIILYAPACSLSGRKDNAVRNFKCLSEKLAAAFRVLDRTFSVLWGLVPCFKHIDFPPSTLFLIIPLPPTQSPPLHRRDCGLPVYARNRI